MTRAFGLAAALGLAVCFGCGDQQDPTTPDAHPAQVARPVDEATLNTITLTEGARQRLGIRTVELTVEAARPRRTVGGEVVVPPGQAVVVSAPLAGTLSAPDGESVPSAGASLAAGEPVFRFQPLLTPERNVLAPADRVQIARTKTDVETAKIDAQRQVEAAKIQLEAAQIAHERAAELLRSKAGSQRSFDEAQAQFDLARKALETAEIRSQFLATVRWDDDGGRPASWPITAPLPGVLWRIDAAAGETVAAGQTLFEVVGLASVWVRVPVYVGLHHRIDPDRPAEIQEYGQPPDAPRIRAAPVAAPPSADRDASTVDLFFVLANEKGRWRPGQTLGVTLTLLGREQRLVVPWSAIVFDVHGSAWVYEEAGPRTYVRRRVEVEYVDEPNAVLAAGPQPGTKVVVEGAAELFGAEFGVGH